MPERQRPNKTVRERGIRIAVSRRHVEVTTLTLFAEISALRETVHPWGDMGSARMEMLDEVLAVLDRRGFTEQADASLLVSA